MDVSLINEFRTVEAFSREAGRAVSIFGSARVAEGTRHWNQAFDISARIASAGFTILTGGGPGIMRAASAGAKSVGGTSVGANIVLPFEPLNTVHQDVSMVFNEFFTRKKVLIGHAEAFVCLPGGVGTLDEMFEILTLIKTERLGPRPIYLIDRSFWSGLKEWLRVSLAGNGFIGAADLDDIHLHDDTEEAFECMIRRLNGSLREPQPVLAG